MLSVQVSGTGCFHTLRSVATIRLLALGRKAETWNPSNNKSHSFLPLTPGNHHFIFSLCELAYLRFSIHAESHNICLFVTGLFT